MAECSKTSYCLKQGMCMLSFIPLLVHITPYHLSSSWLEKLLIAFIDSLSCWQIHLPINAWSRQMSGTKYCFFVLFYLFASFATDVASVADWPPRANWKFIGYHCKFSLGYNMALHSQVLLLHLSGDVHVRLTRKACMHDRLWC
jgi:hypothetical protein